MLQYLIPLMVESFLHCFIPFHFVYSFMRLWRFGLFALLANVNDVVIRIQIKVFQNLCSIFYVQSWE